MCILAALQDTTTMPEAPKVRNRNLSIFAGSRNTATSADGTTLPLH